MATFNKKGFNAVDDFFGGVDDGKPSSEAAISVAQHKNGARVPTTHKRQGLGMKSKPSESLNSERILKVGKRRLTSSDAESDIETNHGDDEEELGRTAIAKDDKKKNSAANIVSAATEAIASKKKKKKGRREREAEKAANTDEAKKAVANVRLTATHDGAPLNEGMELNQHKRKRRKVRSRQKNIYKDKRDKKPEHLLPGSKNYQGRPITPETRAKLGLPEKEDKRKAHVFKSNWDEERANVENGSDLMMLAVDSGVALGEVGTKGNKKTNKRYKNLA